MAAGKLMIMAVAVALVVMGTAEAQTATCASNLVPCSDFLNSKTKPPDTCCGPLKDAVENDLACLCNLYGDPSFFAAFNVTVDEALGLSKRCGVSNDLSSCNAPAQTPSSVSPPGVPGNNGGASKTASIITSGIVSFVLCMMVFNLGNKLE